MPGTIAIITNEFTSKIENSRYLSALLARRWKQQGWDINVTAGCHYTPADIAFMHVDTTVVPDEYLALGKRYPVTLNGGVRDILKTSISKYLLKNDDRYPGPVIVKTNANYGGVNEFNIATQTGKTVWNDPDIERPWRKREIMDSLNYPVFKRLSDVPSGVWKNDRLVVEKFLPEKLANGDYRCRTYIFFGEQEFAAWFCSPNPVIKSSVASSMGELGKIPQAIREIRKKSGFNYGKFDYTEVDGEVFVYDMNKTPAFGAEMRSLFSSQKLDAFADEIHAFV
ncbi:MAG: hypothetical protein WBS20_18225 [Lysobacterales bacterium]